MTIQHRDASKDDNAGKGSHGILSWSDTTDEASRNALVQVAANRGVTIYQTAGTRPGFYVALGVTGSWLAIDSDPTESGWVSGLDLTINVGNSAQYDMAAGAARVQDIPQLIVSAGLTGIDPLNGVTQVFTANFLDVNGDLVKTNNQPLGDLALRRSAALLQVVLHVGPDATITGIDNTTSPSAHQTQGLLDSVYAIGPVDQANVYSANADDDKTIDKAAGGTFFPNLNQRVDVLSPTRQDNPQQTKLPIIVVHRDGSGGFVLSFTLDIPIGFWDDDNLTLSATPKFVNYQIYFFNQGTLCVPGQTTYDTLAQATSAALTENNVLNPAILPGTLRSVISIKGDVTGLFTSPDVNFFAR